ncbi:MAG: hypothetical protein D3921_01720 [Candidatus Electrothrix sp. AW1]|nr:hypothetical protein [Candidatus Electrothrix gigas]MCI5181243.1 hypothetical protein [Candidatus Electrothrix gigas]
MASIELNLFRVKFIRPTQKILFPDNKTSSEIFREAISEKPSSEIRKDCIWHIGNIETIDADGGSFAVGRTTTTTLATYHDESRNFVEESFEDSPYTLCLYDSRIGFIAIAKKSKLASTTSDIAKKVKKLLDKTKIVLRNKIDVRIDPISDPDGFIKKLMSAYSIKRFTASFTGPNPFDADELFQKPISVYCQAINGENGHVVTKGKSLDAEVATKVTKSVAATGNEASANIIESHGERAKNVHLSGDPAKKIFDEDDFQAAEALAAMRNEYKKIREMT